MIIFRVGDVVCIDGELVSVTQDALDADLFDSDVFPATRLATDEEKALYAMQMFPSPAALEVMAKRRLDCRNAAEDEEEESSDLPSLQSLELSDDFSADIEE